MERNPGPLCDACNKTIRRDHLNSSLKCSTEDCDAVCHKGIACSKRSRWKNTEANWNCRAHSTASNETTTTNHQAQPTHEDDRSCEECGKKIKKKSTPLKCQHSTCQKVCHNWRNCSKLTNSGFAIYTTQIHPTNKAKRKTLLKQLRRLSQESEPVELAKVISDPIQPSHAPVATRCSINRLNAQS